MMVEMAMDSCFNCFGVVVDGRFSKFRPPSEVYRENNHYW